MSVAGVIRSAKMTSLLESRTVSIVGCGVMGSRIAAAWARGGFRVRLFDVVVERAEQVRQQLFHDGDGSSPPTPSAAGPVERRVCVARTIAAAAEADLVIETISEDLPAKLSLLEDISRNAGGETLIASNTSSLPISRLASAVMRPGRFCGMHFCHPADIRRLVEIAPASQTDAATCSRGIELLRRIGKVPVLVRDTPGFLLNRLLVPYLNESLELLLVGVELAALNRAALAFGMPVGPLAMLDQFGVDIALAVGRSLLQAYPDRVIPSELLIAVYKSGYRGAKSAAGFCVGTDQADKDSLNTAVARMVERRRRPASRVDKTDWARRMFLPMFLEATRVVDENLVEGFDTIDLILREGLGLAAESPGLGGWADDIGMSKLLDHSLQFQHLGKRFEPTILLQQYIRSGACLTTKFRSTECRKAA